MHLDPVVNFKIKQRIRKLGTCITFGKSLVNFVASNEHKNTKYIV